MPFFSRRRFRFVFAPSCALFVPSQMPGPVLRVVEKNALGTRPAFGQDSSHHSALLPTDAFFPVLLSGPPARSDTHPPWRILCLEDHYWHNETFGASHDLLHHLGPDLSRRLNTTVHSVCVGPSGAWEVVRYENGEEIERDEERRPERLHPLTSNIPSLYNKAPEPLPKLAAWAKKLGLPFAAARRYARVVDYETVAGLERKGLLVESEPVWYRYNP